MENLGVSGVESALNESTEGEFDLVILSLTQVRFP